jgi:mono/diheme cytochrome c family protein
VFGPDQPDVNLAFEKPATQINTSQWSEAHRKTVPTDWGRRTSEVMLHCQGLLSELSAAGVDVAAERGTLEALSAKWAALPADALGQETYLEARWLQRRLALVNPLLNFDRLLFAKRVPGTFNHMSDQYYGWWSRPGGGLFLLSGFQTDEPVAESITASFSEPGSFLRPILDYEANKVLFAWCKYYPGLAEEPNKLDKNNVPEDAFYHLFEMNLDGTGLRQVTHGKYDDFDGRYLPDGRIVFLSTRRGQALQCGADSACTTMAKADLPDSYVRCGGGPERPVAVYTLHTMNADGAALTAISPFEMFEWTPSIAHDGTILYSRWDYVDRYNMPYMSLWSMYPDGSRARVVYGNYTVAPHCTFEPQCIPNSNKIVFTGSAHHAQTLGSLVLLDTAAGTEGTAPITRLTPEVVFPEIEGWSKSYFASPWPLSERYYLVSWGVEENTVQGKCRPENGMGLYLFDAAGGNLELLYRDPAITSESPLPVQARPRPPVLSSTVLAGPAPEGRFLLTDVYHGLKDVPRGAIKSLRIVAVPPKTHPTMNFPRLGITGDDPGKCVFGTVPVEEDGSAYFRVPSGVILFFQARDARGVAVQTMRGATYVQPGQTMSCAGCHESRHSAPATRRNLAGAREPSKLEAGPEGSWPLRFDRLVQPVLDQHCVRCHRPGAEDRAAAKFDLRAKKAYDTLIKYGTPNLFDQVWAQYRQGYSVAGEGLAQTSPLLAKLTAPEGHEGVVLDAGSLERLVTWMDTYAQYLGAFDEEQERALLELREQYAGMILERAGAPNPKLAQAPPAEEANTGGQ